MISLDNGDAMVADFGMICQANVEYLQCSLVQFRPQLKVDAAIGPMKAFVGFCLAVACLRNCCRFGAVVAIDVEFGREAGYSRSLQTD